MQTSLPKLPDDVESVVLAAADRISDAFAAARLPLNTEAGAPSQPLYSAIYLLKERCQAGPGGSGWQRSDDAIPLAEIATVLETIGRVMMSEGVEGMAGYNASFFIDSAAVVTQAERDLERQMAVIDKLLNGLGEVQWDDGGAG